jgi:hypothetical protein
MDLNRSAALGLPHHARRGDDPLQHQLPTITQYDVNFAISVGVEYKFNKKR